MEVIAEYLGNAKFAAVARGHRIICDQPVENGGADEGMTPPEFLLSSLATCAGYYAAQYLKFRNLSMDNLTVHVSAEKAQQPARLTNFQIEVRTSALDAKHEEGVLRAVQKCLVHNTLLHQPDIHIRVHSASLAGVA